MCVKMEMPMLASRLANMEQNTTIIWGLIKSRMVKVPALPALLQVARVSVTPLPSSQMFLARFHWVLLNRMHFHLDLNTGASNGRHQSSMRSGSGHAALKFVGSTIGLVSRLFSGLPLDTNSVSVADEARWVLLTGFQDTQIMGPRAGFSIGPSAEWIMVLDFQPP